MLELLLLRAFAPRAFRLISLIGFGLFLLTVVAIAGGMVSDESPVQVQHFKGAHRMRQ